MSKKSSKEMFYAQVPERLGACCNLGAPVQTGNSAAGEAFAEPGPGLLAPTQNPSRSH